MTGNNGWKGERRPAFPMYAADWLLNGRTRALGPDGRGVYIDLLCLQWREGHIDEADIQMALGDPMAWALAGRREAILAAMLAAFPGGEDGLRRNGRLERERAILEARRAEMAAGGRAGAAARWGSHMDPMGTPMASHGSSSSSSSSSKKKKEAAPAARRSLPSTADLGSELRGKAAWLVEGVTGWLAYRTEKRLSAYTARGLKALVAKVEGMGAERAKAALSHSMAANYQGIFEPPQKNGTHSAAKNTGRYIPNWEETQAKMAAIRNPAPPGR